MELMNEIKRKGKGEMNDERMNEGRNEWAKQSTQDDSRPVTRDSQPTQATDKGDSEGAGLYPEAPMRGRAVGVAVTGRHFLDPGAGQERRLD